MIHFSSQLVGGAGGALPSLEKARALLSRAQSTHEVRKIRAIAQAVASVSRGKEIAQDAAEIILDADARLGELTREIVKAKQPGPGRGKKNQVPRRNIVSKGAALHDEQVTRKEAAECEHLAALKCCGDLERYQVACRRAKKPQLPTKAGALAIGKLSSGERAKVFSKLGEKTDVRQAINEVRLEAKRRLADKLREEPVPLPTTGPFRVIVIDPPWKYDSRVDDTTHRGRNQYPDMEVAEIERLPVPELAHDDCVLWLWATNAFMHEALSLIVGWGFRQKTILTWDKQKLGLGDWLRNVTEHCILATRGSPIVTLSNQTTLISEARREHSRKPEAFYSLVEELCPGSKLEMFARAKRKDWVAWGAEDQRFARRRA